MKARDLVHVGVPIGAAVSVTTAVLFFILYWRHCSRNHGTELLSEEEQLQRKSLAGEGLLISHQEIVFERDPHKGCRVGVLGVGSFGTVRNAAFLPQCKASALMQTL